MIRPDALVALILCVLVLPAVPIVGRVAYRCGREGTGYWFAWSEGWSAVARVTLFFGYTVVLLLAIVSLSTGAGDQLGLGELAALLLAPCALCVGFVPFAGAITVIGYHFGTQRRVSDDLARSQANHTETGL